MTERVLVTIHAAIPVDALKDVQRLCQKLRVQGDGEVFVRQVGGGLHSVLPPSFELYTESTP